MKNPFFRITVAILTFSIGVAATWLLIFMTRPNHLKQAAPALHSFTLPEIKVGGTHSKAPFKLEKIADVPSVEKNDSYTMQALNEKEIWISSKEKMWRTRDGGKNWKLIYDGGIAVYDITNDIVHFQFINSKTGWLLQIKGVPVSSATDFQMRLFKTEDGGDTWTGIAQPVSKNFNAFLFLDDKHGWAVGSAIRRIPKNETRFIRPRNIFMGKDALYAAIYYTEDGGKSWRQQPIPSRPNTISDFSMLDAKHGWAWGDAGDFYFDNGRWKEINYNETKCSDRRIKVQRLEIDAGNPYIGAEAVSFISPKVGWMSHSEGYLAKTTDGGRTWCDLINPEDIWGKQEFPLNSFYVIKFFDSEHGYGFDEESVYETKDGGITWAKLDIEIGALGFEFTDAKHGWAVSKEGLFRIVPEEQLDTSETKHTSSTDVDYYAHLKPKHREILREWLKTKTYLRPAVEELDDYMVQVKDESIFEDNLKFLRETIGESSYQYYAVGDMNQDGRVDFAVLLVDTRKQKDNIDRFALGTQF